MAIPRFNDLFNDVLQVLSDQKQHHRRELHTAVINRIKLSDAERAETMAGGGNRARSRVHWAFEYLCQSGAVRRPRRGYAEITDAGLKLLAEKDGATLEKLHKTKGLRSGSGAQKQNAILDAKMQVMRTSSWI